MEHVQFGRTGLKVSRLCLGTMTFGFQADRDTSFAIMDAAAEAGITFSNSQQEMIRGLVETGDVAGAQQIILDELTNQVGGAASDAAKKAGGQWAQFGNRLSDVGEKIGGVLMDALGVLLPSLDYVLTSVEELTDWLGRLAGVTDEHAQSAEAAGEAVGGWGEQLLRALIAGQTAIQEWQTIWELAVDTAMLKSLQFGSELDHLLSEALPAYLTWFADNWESVFENLGEFTSTIFKKSRASVRN